MLENFNEDKRKKTWIKIRVCSLLSPIFLRCSRIFDFILDGVYLNNYLQKGSIILVIVMALIITNLNIYSFMGNYQTSSQAIIANKDHQFLYSKNEKPFYLEAVVGVVGLGIVAAVFLVARATIAVSPSAAVLALAATAGVLSSDSFVDNNNFAKKDFSQFDN